MFKHYIQFQPAGSPEYYTDQKKKKLINTDIFQVQ